MTEAKSDRSTEVFQHQALSSLYAHLL